MARYLARVVDMVANRAKRVLIVAVVSASLGAPAGAGPYVFSSIDNPLASFGRCCDTLPNHTNASGINNSGVVVGTFVDSTDKSHGFYYVGGSFTNIDAPSAFVTFTHSINDAGAIVGDYYSNGIDYSYIKNGGIFTTINFPSAFTGGILSGISESGVLVGFYRDSGGEAHGIADTAGTFTEIDFPGATYTFANGINIVGTIVGGYGVSATSYEQGFVDVAGIFTTVDFPGALITEVTGINDSGMIVGYYLTHQGNSFPEHGFIENAGSFTTIDFPGAIGTVAYGINDGGTIVGSYDDTIGTHGFLATTVIESVSEPVTLALFGAGLAGAVVMRRRRKCAEA